MNQRAFAIAALSLAILSLLVAATVLITRQSTATPIQVIAPDAGGAAPANPADDGARPNPPGEGEASPEPTDPGNILDSSESPGGSLERNGKIDLNTASVAQLTTLPGIGEVRARAIVQYREERGPFRSVSEVTEVAGIGSGIYEQIQGLVTVTVP